MTTEQFKNKTKTVTRRKGWSSLKPGDVVMGCRKCMGLKPGEKLERFGLIKIISVRREELYDINKHDVIKEGFPDMTASEFVQMFIDHMGGSHDQKVTRIEYEYI